MKVYDVVFHPRKGLPGVVGFTCAALGEAQQRSFALMSQMLVDSTDMIESDILDGADQFWQSVDNHSDQISLTFYDRRNRKQAPMEQYLGTITIRTLEVLDNAEAFLKSTHGIMKEWEYRASTAMMNNRHYNRRFTEAKGFYQGALAMARLLGVHVEDLEIDYEV